MGAVKIKRVVIDTNVLVSALLYKGLPSELHKLWQMNRIRPLYSKAIIEEYLRVLAYPKFKLTEQEIGYLFNYEILSCFEVIQVKPGKAYVKADPSDDKFIWCAIDGKAETIVSGDEHLLSFSGSPVPILSVNDFMKNEDYLP